MQNKYQQTGPALIERIVAALSYITFGLAGFIWLLIGLITRKNLKSYLQYHVFQSIFLSILYFLVSAFLGLIMNILSLIPFVGQLILRVTFYLNAPMILGFSLIQGIINVVLIYLVITSLQGKYSYLPWVSDIIRSNVR